MRKRVKKRLISALIISLGVFYIADSKIIKNEDNKKYNIVQAKESVQRGNTKLMLVNSKNGLEKNYIPENLTVPNIKFTETAEAEEKQVAGIMVKPLEELINAAKKEGVILLGNSGYRSYKLQKTTYNNIARANGKKYADSYVAKPGFSEHQSGLAIDLTNEARYFVEGTKEADWLAKNAHKFGFIIRYPKEKTEVTGIAYEPWHIRYVGKEAAKIIYEKKLTLEEYILKYGG